MGKFVDATRVGFEKTDKKGTFAGDVFDVLIFYNDDILATSYQCNVAFYGEPTKEDILQAVFYDAMAYGSTKNLFDFMTMFGYGLDDHDEAEKVYLACKRHYDRLNEMYGDDFHDALVDVTHVGW